MPGGLHLKEDFANKKIEQCKLTGKYLGSAQPPTSCSFARHLVGKMAILCSFAHH